MRSEKNATNDVGKKWLFTVIYLLKISDLFVKISIGGSTGEAQEASRKSKSILCSQECRCDEGEPEYQTTGFQSV